MSQTLKEIAQKLHLSEKKVQLIYAFNGTGKTRLSREFKNLISPKNNIDTGEEEENETTKTKIIYYNAFTEDLFYWDNDLEEDVERKLKIQPNSFTNLVLEDLGQDRNIITHFQRYTNEKLTPEFNAEYFKIKNDPTSKVEAFTEVTFSFERGNKEQEDNVKISKGEESNFIWSVYYTIIDQVVETLNTLDETDRETDKFNDIEYLFIDDPVSSLDENHLIKLAVDLARLIKNSYFSDDGKGLKFIITTHNPLFYNVLHNELGKSKKYLLQKDDDGSYKLNNQNSDSPFSYHLYLKSELEKAIETGEIHKYHFNFLRNILEKTSTFLGYDQWGDLLPKTDDGKPNPYEARILNIYSHSKHSAEEVRELDDDDKRVLRYLIEHINKIYFLPSQVVGE